MFLEMFQFIHLQYWVQPELHKYLYSEPSAPGWKTYVTRMWLVCDTYVMNTSHMEPPHTGESEEVMFSPLFLSLTCCVLVLLGLLTTVGNLITARWELLLDWGLNSE